MMKIQELRASLKKPRTTEDFLQFCDVVLSYANYPEAFYSDEDYSFDRQDRKIESPLNSIGESTLRTVSDVSSRSSSVGDAEGDTDEDAWGMVTCWCGKPFAGRPMIECESCLIWLHLSCARVRKTNIPEHFTCSRCKGTGRRKRFSSESSETDARSRPTSPPFLSNGGREDLTSHHRSSELSPTVSDVLSPPFSNSERDGSNQSPYISSFSSSFSHYSNSDVGTKNKLRKPRLDDSLPADHHSLGTKTYVGTDESRSTATFRDVVSLNRS